jgi:hypothetical protein
MSSPVSLSPLFDVTFLELGFAATGAPRQVLELLCLRTASSPLSESESKLLDDVSFLAGGTFVRATAAARALVFRAQREDECTLSVSGSG